MDTTIRNLDENAYRALKARAALAGKTIGEMVNEAIAAYLAQPEPVKGGTLRDLVPKKYPAGNEHLSTDIDTIVYGAPAPGTTPATLREALAAWSLAAEPDPAFADDLARVKAEDRPPADPWDS